MTKKPIMKKMGDSFLLYFLLRGIKLFRDIWIIIPAVIINNMLRLESVMYLDKKRKDKMAPNGSPKAAIKVYKMALNLFLVE